MELESQRDEASDIVTSDLQLVIASPNFDDLVQDSHSSVATVCATESSLFDLQLHLKDNNVQQEQLAAKEKSIKVKIVVQQQQLDESLQQESQRVSTIHASLKAVLEQKMQQEKRDALLEQFKAVVIVILIKVFSEVSLQEKRDLQCCKMMRVQNLLGKKESSCDLDWFYAL